MCPDTRGKKNQLLGTEICKTGKHSSRSKTTKHTGLGLGWWGGAGGGVYAVGPANRASGALIQWETGHCFLWASHRKMLMSHSLYGTKNRADIIIL